MKTIHLLLLAALACAFGPRRAAAEDAAFPTSPLRPDLTPGYVLIEGDIQVPLSEYEALTGGGFRPAGVFGGNTVNYWFGLVPYDFVTNGNGAVSAANQTAAVNAMNAIAARAGVTFRPAGVLDVNRIRFQASTVNNSPVGMRGGTQIINITNWGIEIIICHEIYHSLGFHHEQGRTDRGLFITINSANICGSSATAACAPSACRQCQDTSGNWTDCSFNFAMTNAPLYGPYDFDSFMHYPRTAFSCNGGDTITVNAPWNAQWQDRIGQSDHFSYFDTITCRALYPFAGDRWLDRAYGGPVSGTFHQPSRNTTLAGALADVPTGGTLFIKYGNSYSAVGTYNRAVTIVAPVGGVTLSN